MDTRLGGVGLPVPFEITARSLAMGLAFPAQEGIHTAFYCLRRRFASPNDAGLINYDVAELKQHVTTEKARKHTYVPGVHALLL